MNKTSQERIRLAEQGIWKEPQVRHEPINCKKLIVPIATIVTIVAAVVFLTPVIEKARENPNISELASGMLGVLPIVVVAVTLLSVLLSYLSGGRCRSRSGDD